MQLDDFRVSFDAETIPNEYFHERIRNWRNAKLIASDWTQVSDAVCDKNAWAIYRQELRDITKQFKNLNSIVFPVSPDEASTL
jgi:hypothetical protein